MFDNILDKARFYGRLHIITGCGMIVSFFLMLHAMLTFNLNGITYSFPVTFALAIINWGVWCKFDRITNQIVKNLGDASEEHF